MEGWEDWEYNNFFVCLFLRKYYYKLNSPQKKGETRTYITLLCIILFKSDTYHRYACVYGYIVV